MSTQEHAQADIMNKSPHDQLSSNFSADTIMLDKNKTLTEHQTSQSLMIFKWTVA